MADWKKEAARDVIALGSIPFYTIVIARALIGPYWNFFYQLIIAAAILYVVSLLAKKANYYVSRSLILLFFTQVFYADLTYTAFASLLWIALAFSVYYLGKSKTDSKNEIMWGVFLGASVSLITQQIVSLAF